MAIQKIGTVGGGSNFDVVLKDFSEGPVREHLNNKVTLLQYVEKSKRSWTGRRVQFPVHLTRNSGVGARGETSSLPAAGSQGFVTSNILAKYMYGRITLTGAVIAASQGSAGAFATAMKTEIDGMRRDLRNDMNRQCYGNFLNDAALGAGHGGKTGVMSLVTTPVGTVTTVTCDNPGSRYVKVGDALAIGTVAELTSGTPIFAEALTVPSRTTFTMASATIVDNDLIVRGDANGNSFNNEITGIDHIVQDDSDFDLQGVDVGANADWKAHNEGNAGTDRPLSLELMQLTIDAIDEKGGDEPNLIIGHHSLRREYINLLTSDVRYAPEQLRGGFQKLTYAGGSNPITIEFDKHATYNKLFFLSTGDLKLYVQKDWGWADQDGSVLSRVTGKDQWEAFMCWYGNLGCERRNTHGVLSDVSVSNLIF